MNEWYAYDKLCEVRHSLAEIRHRFSIAERELKGTEFEGRTSSLFDDLEEFEKGWEQLTNGLYKNLMKGEEEK